MAKVVYLVRLICLVFLITPTVLWAQTAALLSDRLEINGNSTITASGNVEILFEDTRLTASRLTYSNKTQSLIIEGPITLQQGDDILILADQAELDADLQNGVLRSARMVLNQQLQIASAQINRVDGRYTQMSKTVASSCRVCANRPVPLWQIRAKSIIHDTQEQQLYFEGAQFRIANIPVLYIPRLRMPDPTLKRATGFLMPRFRESSRLGFGIKIPYFITIADHADITLTPYISKNTNTLEARYRQAFHNGRVEVNAAITQDTLLPDETRGYLFGKGSFDLGRDYKLGFDLALTSDPSYLLEYGYSGRDRLESSVDITRTRHDEYILAGVRNFRTLRGAELAIQDQLPEFQSEIRYEKRFFPDRIGGQGSFQFSLDGYQRDSTDDMLGRDVSRFGGEIDWARNWVLSNGMIAKIGGKLSADLYQITQDSDYAPYLAFITPAAEAELRWPLARSTRRGASQVLEPVLNLAWTDRIGEDVPNESSTLVEFDEGNLYALSRFPGNDRYERGARATFGVGWTHYDPNGWSLGTTFGRVLRQDELNDFSNASGLNGLSSNWLAAVKLNMGTQFEMTTRALLDDDLSLTKVETRLNWNTDRLDLGSSYTWIIADESENRPDLMSQMTLDASYDLNDHWNATVDGRYDFLAEKATRAGFGLQYINECVSVDLSLSRRFTSSTSVKPTTDIGFQVGLRGFGNDGRRFKGRCSG